MFRISYSILKTNLVLSVNKQLRFKVLSDNKCFCYAVDRTYKCSLEYEHETKTYRHPKKIIKQNLLNFYDIDFDKSEKLLKSYDFIKLFPAAKLTKNCQLLKEENVTVDRIIKCINILSFDNLKEKVELLKEVPYTINDLFPLLNVKIWMLRRLLADDLQYRIECISKLIELPVLEVSNLLTKSAFAEMELETFKERFNLLKSYGMSIEEMNKNCDVYRMDGILLTHRLEKLKENGIKRFDSKMLCKYDDGFQKQFRKVVITRGDTTQEYLRNKLKLTPEQLDSLTLRLPRVYKKNVEVIEIIINTLFSRGFKGEHIINCPAVLMTSVAKIVRRLNDLNNLEGRKNELYRIVANEKLYKHYFCKI